MQIRRGGCWLMSGMVLAALVLVAPATAPISMMTAVRAGGCGDGGGGNGDGGDSSAIDNRGGKGVVIQGPGSTGAKGKTPSETAEQRKAAEAARLLEEYRQAMRQRARAYRKWKKAEEAVERLKGFARSGLANRDKVRKEVKRRSLEAELWKEEYVLESNRARKLARQIRRLTGHWPPGVRAPATAESGAAERQHERTTMARRAGSGGEKKPRQAATAEEREAARVAQLRRKFRNTMRQRARAYRKWQKAEEAAEMLARFWTSRYARNMAAHGELERQEKKAEEWKLEFERLDREARKLAREIKRLTGDWPEGVGNE